MSDHQMADDNPLLQVRDVRKSFRVPHAGKNTLCALDGITLDLKRGKPWAWSANPAAGSPRWRAP